MSERNQLPVDRIEPKFVHQGFRGDPLLAIVLPAYNESEVIRGVILEFFKEIVAKLPSTFMVAEDGSVDQTPSILASLSHEIPISLLSGRDRKGYAKGVCDAIKSCKEEWVFFSDSDGQYYPSDFWKLWGHRHEYDMVVGRKIHRSEGISRTILSKGFNGLVNTLFSLNLHDSDCGFRLIRKNVIQSIAVDSQILKYSFWTEFTIRASFKGFRILEVPINHASRTNGKTRMYPTSKIPSIIVNQLRGLSELFVDLRRAE